MAKRHQKQSDGTETEIDDGEIEDHGAAEVEQSPGEPVQAADEKPSLEGLVKMAKDGKIIHAHPSAIAEHSKNGWKPA